MCLTEQRQVYYYEALVHLGLGLIVGRNMKPSGGNSSLSHDAYMKHPLFTLALTLLSESYSNTVLFKQLDGLFVSFQK